MFTDKNQLDDKLKLTSTGKEAKIEEGWCKNIGGDEYRKRVHQAMMLAQNNYEQRRLKVNGMDSKNNSKLNELVKEHQKIVDGKYDENFRPFNKNSIEEIEKRKVLKLSSCRGKSLERYFEINKDDKFAYFDNPKAAKPKKVLETNQFECKIEEKSKLNATELKTWHEKDQSKLIRLKIAVPKKSK